MNEDSRTGSTANSGHCADCGLGDAVAVWISLRQWICPKCAAKRILTLQEIADERAKDWQAERIRAERLAERVRALEANDGISEAE